jgi:Type IV secretion-system coupling protein DNA-binding domain
MASERSIVDAVIWAITIQVKAIFYVIRFFFRLFLFWRSTRPVKPQLFRLSPDARFAHTHIVAGSGHGKTQLIQHMIETQDLEKLRRRNASVIVIDSQGDLIKTISRLREFSRISSKVSVTGLS